LSILIEMNIIFFIHVLLFLVMIVIPFTADEVILSLYSLLIPFLFFHWATNDDTCALTEIEMKLTGNKKEDTFFGRLVGPIYKLDNTTSGLIPKFLFLGLWLFVQHRLKRIPYAERVDLSGIFSKLYK
tara:strand:- start:7675 stop:8058 length:384 start_codon:yes stop_codon:yes gene_type:complete